MSGTRKAVFIILGILGALILVAIIGIVAIWAALAEKRADDSRQQRAHASCCRRVAGLQPG